MRLCIEPANSVVLRAERGLKHFGIATVFVFVRAAAKQKRVSNVGTKHARWKGGATGRWTGGEGVAALSDFAPAAARPCRCNRPDSISDAHGYGSFN